VSATGGHEFQFVPQDKRPAVCTVNGFNIPTREKINRSYWVAFEQLVNHKIQDYRFPRSGGPVYSDDMEVFHPSNQFVDHFVPGSNLRPNGCEN